MKVSLIDAGRFDANTAYAAINTFRLDDLRPHIFRTHDGGKTWKEIVNGLPNGGIVNSVREDSQRKGLLYCGTEQAVYFSIDDGENWQPLRLNMPATSIRDVVVHNDDLVVGTHGRSFWILDDVTPLRQLNQEVTSSNSFLFAPQTAIRVRRSVHTDTPFPPEEPAGQNPPDGAIINYYLKSKSATPIVLEIYDSANKLVRRFSSDDKPLKVDEKDFRFPTYWIRPAKILSNEAGMQRFVWDLQYANPPADSYDLPISAVVHDTPFVPEGPFVMPAKYTIKFTANGKTSTQILNVKMDPRVVATNADLQQQFTLSLQAYEGVKQTFSLLEDVKKLQEKLKSANDKELSEKLNLLVNGAKPSVPIQPQNLSELSLNRLNGAFSTLLGVLQEADAKPTMQAVKTAQDLQNSLTKVEKIWYEIIAEAKKKGY
jgi:hypothetical protein